MNIDNLRDEDGNLPFKDAPFEAATLVGLDFDHRSDEDWEELRALFKAHPEWTLDVVTHYFGVTATYAGRLVDMYLTNTLPIVAKQFPENSLEQMLAKVGVFAEEYVRSLDSKKVATIIMHWGSLLRYYIEGRAAPTAATSNDDVMRRIAAKEDGLN